MALLEEFDASGNWLFRHRTYLPLILVGLAGFVIFLDKNPTFSHQNFIFIAICLAISFSGLIFRSVTIGFVPRFTSGRNTKKQVAHFLNTEGIYATVRHPLYVGNFLMWIGIVLFTGNVWFTITVILMYWLYYERIMFAEEQFLRNKFGATYVTWSNQTRAFIPNFRKWRSPSLQFSWKTVFKREDNGFLGMILGFVLVEILRNLSMESRYLMSDFWMWVFAISSVIYLVVRTIRKTTRLLHEERVPDRNDQ